MKKILTIAALLISWRAFAQQPTVQKQGAPSVLIRNLGAGSFDSAVYLPNRDTAFTPAIPSCVIIRQADGLMYSWTGGPWKVVGTPVWGKIISPSGGSLANQTDLYDSLQARQRTLANGYGWIIVNGAGVFDSARVRKVDTMYRVNDSTVGYTINGIPYTALLRGTAAGGINSLILTVPTVLYSSPLVFNSNGGAWTDTLVLATQAPGTFFAAPPTGAAASPTFRIIALSDLPTGIPNANLANSTLALSITNTGTAPAFSATSVALGSGIVLNLPYASPTTNGILSAANFNIFSSAATAAVTSVNGQVGAVSVRNADSLGGYPINFTNFHNGYVLAIDTPTSTLVFQAPGSGSGINTLNGLNATTQTFAIGTAGTSPNISSLGSVHTFNTPIVNGADSGIATPGLYNYWNVKLNPADSLANNPADFTTQASRQKLSDSLQSLFNAAIALKKSLNDSSATNPAAFTTQASRQKLSDSLYAVFTAAITLKKNANDSLATSPGGFTTQASRQKLSDSLNALIALRRLISDSAGPTSPLSRGAGYKAIDSLAATIVSGTVDTTQGHTGAIATISKVYRTVDSAVTTPFNLYVQRSSARGDSLLHGYSNFLRTPGIVDSGGFKHFANPDSTWSLYVPFVPSGLFRFSDSICETINGIRVCVLDSTGSGGSGTTNLASVPGVENVVITSSTGASATILPASLTQAGGLDTLGYAIIHHPLVFDTAVGRGHALWYSTYGLRTDTVWSKNLIITGSGVTDNTPLGSDTIAYNISGSIYSNIPNFRFWGNANISGTAASTPDTLYYSVFNVKDFGLKDDSATDNTPLFMSMEAVLPVGATVLFPGGGKGYLFNSDSVLIYKRLRIIGDGKAPFPFYITQNVVMKGATNLYFNSATNNLFCYDGNDTLKTLPGSIFNLSIINLATTPTAGAAIVLRGNTEMQKFENLTIANFYDDINVISANSLSIDECNIVNPYHAGINLGNLIEPDGGLFRVHDNNIVSGTHTNTNNAVAIYFHGGGAWDISGNNINSQATLTPSTFFWADLYMDCRDGLTSEFHFDYNFCDNYGTYGIRAVDSTSTHEPLFTINGNNFSPLYGSSTSYAIWLSHYDDVSVTGNVSKGQGNTNAMMRFDTCLVVTVSGPTLPDGYAGGLIENHGSTVEALKYAPNAMPYTFGASNSGSGSDVNFFNSGTTSGYGVLTMQPVTTNSAMSLGLSPTGSPSGTKVAIGLTDNDKSSGNFHYMNLSTDGTNMDISSLAAGTDAAIPLLIHSGANTDQLLINPDSSIRIGTRLTFQYGGSGVFPSLLNISSSTGNDNLTLYSGDESVANSNVAFELSGKGTGTGSMNIIGGDIVASPSNFSYITLTKNSSNFDVASIVAGTGTQLPMRLYAGASNAGQLTLNTNGGIQLGTYASGFYHLLDSVNTKLLVKDGSGNMFWTNWPTFGSGGTGSRNADSIQGIPVSATTPTTGQVLQYNGTNYVPTIPNGGGIQGTLQTIGDASYTIASGDETIVFTTTFTADRTCTLPAATTANRHIRIILYNIGGPTYQLSIQSGSTNIYNVSSTPVSGIPANTTGVFIDFVSNGTNWYVTGTGTAF